MGSVDQTTLEDRFELESGRVLLSGAQALVRLPLMQRAADARAGYKTAGYISGYRGSPLGGYDMQLTREHRRLSAADIVFHPAVNEELAATAIWGTQQACLFPGATIDGVFAIWYGKGPGVDRSGDAIKHANRIGTAELGGVLVVFGDDHPGKSSTIAHQSEQALAANGIPVLYPATVQEYIDYGLHGFALSRYSGLWIGLKCVNETVETTSVVEVRTEQVNAILPERPEPPTDGVNARLELNPLGDDIRLVRHKLPRAHSYARENKLDRVTHGEQGAELGIVAAGKTWLDVSQALHLLELDESRIRTLKLAVYKPALIWPLEPYQLNSFAKGLRELLFVEEKAAFLESQAAHILFNLPNHSKPRLAGKCDPSGAKLLPADVQLEPLEIALVIASRLADLGISDTHLEARAVELRQAQDAAADIAGWRLARDPYFCSGCPHNTSTQVPEGSHAWAGIGCHTMARRMNRRTLPPVQMGGEGVNWTGIAPFTDTKHVFQNLGDGTYFHSGLMAIRAAVHAGVNITYKILINDAVAMTGGQPVEGQLTVGEITQQLRAERVQRIAVVSEDIGKYRGDSTLAPGTSLHDRADLETVQRDLRNAPGVSAILYEQVCAAEKRRRRKRGLYPRSNRRVYINPLVCEGCGDCSRASNCVSVEPLETEYGRKRQVDQSSCNTDYSCLQGFCPSFVTVEGADRPRKMPLRLADSFQDGLPKPIPQAIGEAQSILITGIGGTGVVTVGAVLAMAAHLEGKAASVFDMTGLAQKGGSVLSHLRVSSNAAILTAPRIGTHEADLVLGNDLVVTSSKEVLRTINPDKSRVVLNSHLTPTAAFQRDGDIDFDEYSAISLVKQSVRSDDVQCLDANQISLRLLGDTIGANMLLVGYALQKGWLPIDLESVTRAIELNGAAVPLNLSALGLGRLAAHEPGRLRKMLDDVVGEETSLDTLAPIDDGPAALQERIARRCEFLTRYQDVAYANRYAALVDRVRSIESLQVPSADALTDSVARYYFKLLAYKDEYEVARLHTEGLRSQLPQVLLPGTRLRFHLAPPILARKDRATGRPVKTEFGSWMFYVLRMLAKCKWVRGTVLDVFGFSAERRSERRLIAEYEALIEEILHGLTNDNHRLAVRLASVPEQIRGFGHVKSASVAAAKIVEKDLLSIWRNGQGDDSSLLGRS